MFDKIYKTAQLVLLAVIAFLLFSTSKRLHEIDQTALDATDFLQIVSQDIPAAIKAK